MDIKDAAAEYRPEITPQTREGSVPPGYKRTEVGVIPEDWAVVQLEENFDIASSKRVLQSQWQTTGVPFYRTREIADLSEIGAVDNELFISKELYKNYAATYGVPQVGDILVTGIGTIGLAYVVQDTEPFYFKDASVIWLKNRGSFDAEFLGQLFRTRIIKDQIANSSTGTTVATYTISGAKKTAVPAPSLAEQHTIAEALSDADALIAALQRL
ncbi:MAG TPA: restriction endonuclease subunit S, partial [Wenzhouxiangella sp.]|nr:restriction endonuclease subunit S [Wenzhouxiangella sp.]